MYDAIVIGARCAGSPLAMLLARQGYRVLALDRDHFPSDTISTHLITGDGPVRLERWGLLDRVLDTNAPAEDAINFHIGGRRITLEPPLMTLAPRRFALDTVLVEAAREAGAEVVEGASVRRLLWRGGRVCGVSYISEDGAEVDVNASVVVGADGRNSRVAREVGAQRYHEYPAETCGYFSYWSGVPTDGMEVFYAPGRSVVAFPTNDGRVLLSAQWPRSEFPAFRADPLGNLIKSFDIDPGLARRVERGTREEPLSGMLTPDSYFRRSAGPGWALVGDAGCFKDPVLGLGINDAFRSADQLAEAIDAGLRGAMDMDQSLAEYEALRDKTSMTLYEITQQFASLNVRPAMVEALVSRAGRRRAA